jgi:hypothetical protein
MVPKFIVLTSVLVLPGLVQAQDEVRLPSSHPPRFATAKAVNKDGIIEINLIVPTQLPERRIRVVERDGKKVEEVEAVIVVRIVRRTLIADGKQLAVMGKNGKKIDAMELPKLLARPTAVLLFVDGDAFDPYYLQIAHDQALAITVADKNPRVTVTPLE